MTTVGKLRFMQKAKQETVPAVESAKPDVSPESIEKWSLSSVDPSSIAQPSRIRKPLQTIEVVARRSYGGANPYIEQIMGAQEKSRKRSRKSVSSD